MAYATIDTDSGTVAANTTVTPTVGTATTGDDVFIHLMWSNPAISAITDNDWTLVTGTDVVGPEYASAVYHLTLAGADNLAISWTGSSDVAWQVIGADGLAATPVDVSATVQSTTAATLPRLSGLSATDHVLCFAGAVNIASKDNVKATPDVGFMTAENTAAVSGFATLWVGQYGGTIGDLDTTFPAAVYFDPPPTHSVGHTVSVLVA